MSFSTPLTACKPPFPIEVDGLRLTIRRGNQYADPTVSPTFLRNPASCSQTLITVLPPSLPTVPIPRPHMSLTKHLRPRNATHSALLQNLALLARTIPAHKIFLYQVADAAPPSSPPTTIAEAPHAPARMTWSRASRLFPCEDGRGAWLPVTDMSLAVVEAGYPAAFNYTCGDEEDAWWSLEVFNGSLTDPRPECVPEHGARGLVGLRTLWDRVCAGIAEAGEHDQTMTSPSPTPSQDSSDESGSFGAVLSDSDTSEEIAPLSVAASNEWSLGSVASTKWTDSCIVG